MQRRFRLGARALCHLAALMLLACEAEPRGVRLVLITVDTLRYDGLSANAQDESDMPLLWRRSSGGAVFNKAYAATSATQPTHASIFTGLDPWRHGVTRNGQALGDGHVTVAEVLREQGFETAAIVASFPLERRFGFAQGFSIYRDSFKEELTQGTWEGAPGPEGGRFYSKARTVTEQAIAVLDELEGERQFLWLHYFDPHAPYGDSREAPTLGPASILRLARRGKPADDTLELCRGAYDADLAYLDHWLERLFERLDRDSERFSTHVVLTSDHGESFGEGGAIAHGKRLTEEQIHVPLVLLSPRVEAQVREDPTGSVDLAATLLSLAGLDAGTVGIGGRDLLRRPRGRATARGMRRTFSAQRVVERRSDGSVHPITGQRFFLVGPRGEIYRGNGESVTAPIGAVDRDAVAGLFASWSAEVEGRDDLGATLDPETARALAALGYVD